MTVATSTLGGGGGAAALPPPQPPRIRSEPESSAGAAAWLTRNTGATDRLEQMKADPRRRIHQTKVLVAPVTGGHGDAAGASGN